MARTFRLAPWVIGLVAWGASSAHGQAPQPPPTSADPSYVDVAREGLMMRQGRAEAISSWFPRAMPRHPNERWKELDEQLAPGFRERPRPGSFFDPGAAGPGVSSSPNAPFLGGTFDPRTGWPVVLLDHLQPRPERIKQFWVVNTYECPQELTLESGRNIKVRKFDGNGRLTDRDPSELLAQVVGKPVVIQVHGSLTYADAALGSGLWSHTWLTINGAISPDAVFIIFDWPSWRVHKMDFRDVNEKGRRSYVSGLHLGQFLAMFPPETRICLIGQSYGGRVVLSALQLLGGGELDTQSSFESPVRLPMARDDLHLRAVLIASATDRDWLAPGKRLGHALANCEGLLNLYNRRDEALMLYPLLIRSGHRAAMGRAGLNAADLEALGPWRSKFQQMDVNSLLGNEHSLLDATANPSIGRAIAPYAWSPDPGPAAETQPARRRKWMGMVLPD